MTWWILLCCLIISVWGLVDTVDRDPSAARLWMVALAVTIGLTFVFYAQKEELCGWERDNSAVHAFQSMREEE